MENEKHVIVTDLCPKESECIICGAFLVGCTKGIPMYEGCAVPNDWDGDWVGFDACDKCFDLHENGEMPTWPYFPIIPTNNAGRFKI